MKRYFGLLLPVLFTLAGLAVIFCLPARRLQPAQAAYAPDAGIVVNTLEDELNSDGDCSFREAVTAANTNAAVDGCPAGEVLTDTITFSVDGIFTINTPLSVTAGGPMTIDGDDRITTHGGGTMRVWYVDIGGDLTLQNLSVVGGHSNQGGGLFNNGKVTIANSTFSANVAENGGGIFNAGALTVLNSTFTNNEGVVICPDPYTYGYWVSFGGGISNIGALTITHSTFMNNNVFVYGGEYGDYAGYGGGIDNNGTLSITNSTFVNNSVSMMIYCDSHVGCNGSYHSYGGGINNGGTLSIVSSTISGNSTGCCSGSFAGFGGGVNSWGSVTLVNTIVANSIYGGDCYGPINDGGHNLDSDGTCSLLPAHGSLPKTDPRLVPLQDNGGPTWTQSLLPDSPAIDTGDYTQCPSTDQRGFYRPIDGDGNGVRVCDIGAFESGAIGSWGINLFPPYQHRAGLPGATLTYTFNFLNQTAISDTYSLELGPHTWATAISTEALGPLPPDGPQAFTLTVTIPPETAWSQFDTVVITATSVTNPTVNTAAAQITTQTYVISYLPILLKEQSASNLGP
jgi:CSLREA domain-containing protein